MEAIILISAVCEAWHQVKPHLISIVQWFGG